MGYNLAMSRERNDPDTEDYLEDSPDERPRRRWPVVLALVVAVLLLAVGAYVSLIINNVAKITTKPFELSGLADDGTGRTNILLLGKGDQGHSGQELTDTIMVLSLDRQSQRVAQISIPRDMRVQIPGYGVAKINSANAHGGVEAARQTVANMLDIPIHYYVVSDFSGIKDLVDAVGGLDVDVKQRLVDANYPCDDNQYKACGLRIEPGPQHMNGATALQYVRCRKGTCGDDFGRADRQQQILNLLRAKLVQWQLLINPTKLAPLTAALQRTLKTDLGSLQMLLAARAWQKAGDTGQPIRLVLHHGPGGYLVSAGGSDLLPADGSFAAIRQRVDSIFSAPTRPTDLPN
jgi:polyisoprenyl-teichoic acid--peptidoglycan teichoic acid transferase